MNRFYKTGALAKVFIFLMFLAFTTSKSNAQIDISVGLSIRIAPPELPVYEQPECPGDDYIWTPGYWAYEDDDYYWVPGVWVEAPETGYLWTPNYWSFEDDGFYRYHAGYWGPHIGFYGGVNYGHGYGGDGYYGGRWDGGHFRYNTAVSRVNVTVVHNTYIDRTVIINNNTTINNRTSFNGRGGIIAQPRPEQRQAMAEHHVQPTPQQAIHQQNAGKDRSQFVAVNHGKPAVAAMNKVGGNRYTPQGRPAAPAVNVVRPNPVQNKVPPARQPNTPPVQNHPAVGPVARPAHPANTNQVPVKQAPKPQVQPSNQPQRNQPQQRPVAQPRPQQQPKPQTTRPQAQPQNQPQQRPVAQPRPQVQPKPQTPRPQAQPPKQPQPRPVAQPRPQVQPKPQPKPPQPRPKAQPKPPVQPKPQPKP